VWAESVCVHALEAGRRCHLKIEPCAGSVDVGVGPGKAVTKEIEAGCEGLILDGRNRPLSPPGGIKGRLFQEKLFREMGLL